MCMYPVYEVSTYRICLVFGLGMHGAQRMNLNDYGDYLAVGKASAADQT